MQFFTNEYTEVIQKLVREVVNDPSTYLGSKYLPSVALPVAKVRTEVIEATGGLTNEHVPGTSPKYIQSFGTRVQEYQPPFYKEAIHYDEKKILFLRELGNNGRNVRGVQQYLDIDVDRLNRRIEARIEKQRWDTMFNGGFTWNGLTVSFGIPSKNRAVPVGAVWSSDGSAVNNSANPVADIRYWLMGGLAAFRKYTVTKMVMNPNTARWILDNTNTRSYVASFGANPSIGDFELNKVLQFLMPGCPPVEVYKGWYQTESTASGQATSTGGTSVTGQLTVSDAIYFIPDGYIFFETSLPGSDKIGEFMQTIHLASGSVDAPGYGKFLVVEDNTAPGTKGGPSNPYIDLVGGVYGGVKLDRGFDVLTAKVT
jgi:Phage major capsid protein E